MPMRWIKPEAKVAGAAAAVAAGLATAPGTGLAGALAAVLSPAMLAALEGGVPTHDPPRAPREAAVFLRSTAAEIEPALLVQYLYAAYSLKRDTDVPDDDPDRVKRQEQLKAWRQALITIAKEEMGHLMTVQNLL